MTLHFFFFKYFFLCHEIEDSKRINKIILNTPEGDICKNWDKASFRVNTYSVKL